NISRLTTLSTQISIRGINSADSAPGFETGVAVILDDVYVGRAAGFSTSLLDIERIEVLRGPQGTLQGRNVIGGSINIVTAQPSDEFFAKGKISYGNYDQFVATGVVGGPIVEGKLAGKVAVGRYYHDGFGENVSLNKPLDTEDAWSYRAQLAFTPTDDLKILLTGDYDTYDMHDFHNDFGPSGISAPTPDLLDRKVEGDVWNTGEREVWGGALNVYYDINDAISLTSITSYRGYDVGIVQEADPWLNFGPAGAGTFVATAANDQSQKQFTQEVRLAGDAKDFSWLFGLYYYAETLENYQNFLFTLNTGSFLAGGSTIDDSKTTTDSYAAFGSANLRLTDLLSVSGGLRYTINDRRVRVGESYGVDGFDPLYGEYVDYLSLDDPAPRDYDATI
ncbi:MAG: TonB-dependent receptor, partial [Amphiplicatus sp.]|nr:TonB-dependent receptor [Amphiplicatus sp.]